jgi:hypothetical protein
VTNKHNDPQNIEGIFVFDLSIEIAIHSYSHA